ncbi:MAG TPA: hypothetical protein VF064_06980 [Pyrinomonadaceae bacterium]
MAFILTKDRPRNSDEEWNAAWEAYSNYIQRIKDRLPRSAYEFATAPWHYDFTDHKSPHDGWLEAITIREPSHGERQQYRTVEIAVRLLAAYHDGQIELVYTNVYSYSLDLPAVALPADNRGHRDWLYDEIGLSEQGNVLHEIEWSRAGGWLIECEDISYRWKPFG